LKVKTWIVERKKIMREIVGLIFIGIGLFFDLVGCIGLVRMPDVYNRLQASTKCVTLGTCSILFGTFIMLGLTAAGFKVLLCMVFVALTAPVSAHALSRGAYRSGIELCDKSVTDMYREYVQTEKNKE
jgi:multicomponent Na+:H+ antiporter subunit G